MDKYQGLNQLSVRLLERLGNNQPQKEQIELVTSLLIKVDVQHNLRFDSKLTPQEICCLLLAAKGKTMKEAARLLKIETSTVQTYHKSIKYKLACSSIAQAVFEGIRFGHVPLVN